MEQKINRYITTHDEIFITKMLDDLFGLPELGAQIGFKGIESLRLKLGHKLKKMGLSKVTKKNKVGWIKK